MAKTTSFVLGEHFEQLIAQQMHTGRYSSASEVVREALRIFENQQAAIKRLNDAIEEGYASLSSILDFNNPQIETELGSIEVNDQRPTDESLEADDLQTS